MKKNQSEGKKSIHLARLVRFCNPSSLQTREGKRQFGANEATSTVGPLSTSENESEMHTNHACRCTFRHDLTYGRR